MGKLWLARRFLATLLIRNCGVMNSKEDNKENGGNVGNRGNGKKDKWFSNFPFNVDFFV